MSEKQEDITKTQEQAQEQPKREETRTEVKEVKEKKESWFDKNPILTTIITLTIAGWVGRIGVALIENRRNRS